MTKPRGWHAPALNPALLSTLASAIVLAVFAAVGGWMRRWIADDGLIVLRTVRNLQAGNGPVFNAGERVEANTSTLWQYLIWIVSEILPMRLEVIVLGVALACTIAAVVVGALGAGHLYRGAATWVFAPVGGIVYLAVPPARDFATSGLEWGLCLLWLAVAWFLLVLWADGRWPIVLPVLAVWAGLSWLVRPELALYGGVIIVVLALAQTSVRRAAGVFAWAIPLPLAYEIFRMGYYGLITPHTAVAKSASDSEWGTGWAYFVDFLHPYGLWIAAILLIALAVWQARQRRTDAPAPGRWRWASGRTAVAIMIGCALLHILYIIRVGGDFMHGRMLLIPFFALLLPVMVLPVLPMGERRLALRAPGVAGLCLVLVWGGVVIVRSTPPCGEPSGVVNEREFWTCNTKRIPGNPPKNGDDFLAAAVMQDYMPVLDGAIAHNDAELQPIVLSEDPEVIYSWMPLARRTDVEPSEAEPLTLYPTVLGTPGVKTPLDVAVRDSVGLATPLAARMPRIPGGRVGHDKWLTVPWQVAASDADISRLPDWIDRDQATLAREALKKPEFQELFATYRDPLTVGRFFANIRFALTTGRTLSFSDDPRDYFTPEEVREILGH